MQQMLRTPSTNMRWVCHHLHIDKSKTATPARLTQSNVHMKEKWELMRAIKHDYTKSDLEKRMHATMSVLVDQGCYKMRTFVDVDHVVGLVPLECALNVKAFWKERHVDLQVGTQLLEGLTTPENIRLFLEASKYVDFIGCLPSRDEYPEKHLDMVFSTAKDLNKDVEAHLDQCNIPCERETELFCNMVESFRYQGKSRAIHCVSLACQPLSYQTDICQRLNELDIGVIVCPSAAISMTQHQEYQSPIHNSIAPVKEMLHAGVQVGLGVDNIEDMFMPFCDGDLIFELRLLAEAERLYDPEELLKIASHTMGFEV